MKAVAQRGVQRQQDVVAKALLGGDQHAHRTPRFVHSASILLRELATLVEDGETHHVPAHVEAAHRHHFEQPPRRDPGPRAQRIEPEVDFHITAHSIPQGIP